MRSEFQDQGVSLHQPRLVALEFENGFHEPYNNEAVKTPQRAYGDKEQVKCGNLYVGI